ncbi:MAG: diaminopimelate epimerase [Gammaproteobacteria bacterium GWF2_41_13]|nr:MAG: diaminopimelate epimerase [Gammaproteobacteria bacterium GWF2_41_13]
MFDFCKYHSLGNDFIVLDFLSKTNAYIDSFLNPQKWPPLAKQLCDRHYGIGADGILIIRYREKREIEVLLYNADGSHGFFCLNGLRCIAHYLVTQRNQAAHLSIIMSKKTIIARVKKTGQTVNLSLSLPKPHYQGRHTLTLHRKKITGHIVDAGNPHFVIFDEVDSNWLSQHGAKIESNPFFPHKTNVEFVWSDITIPAPTYHLLVFERGCGITLACGSGAAAAMIALTEQGKIEPGKTVTFNMQGGDLSSFIDTENQLHQEAPAQFIFKGNYKLD